jgi:formylglycine-generating enzyme required for sulfatase activity
VTIEQYNTCSDVFLDRQHCLQSNDVEADLRHDLHQPQSAVDWYTALYFCNWRRARLPSDVEWEYAARGPMGFLFPWGNAFIKENVVPVGSIYRAETTYVVGSIAENRSWIGVFDLAGNVQEWVEDRFDTPPSYFVDLEGSPFDTFRIVRGGSWGQRVLDFLSTTRQPTPPTRYRSTYGFRCARTSYPD